MPDVHLCPDCGQAAAICRAPLFKFLYRLDLPYFVCVRCQTVGYDRRLVGQLVRQLRHEDVSAAARPYEEIRRLAIVRLDDIIRHRVEKMGYRNARFKRKPRT